MSEQSPLHLETSPGPIAIENSDTTLSHHKLCDLIGYHFVSDELCQSALTHKSYFNENYEKSMAQNITHNERLEFLGDAVLDLVLSDKLMQVFSELAEGELSKIRASLVNETALAEVALNLGVQNSLLLGKGEKLAGGATKPRLLASALEALIGAIYRDGGFLAAQKVIENLFATKIASLDLTVHFKDDYKTHLQEKTQKTWREIPQYEVVSEDGPDHQKIYTVSIKLKAKEIAQGQGRTKKQAEQSAAQLALAVLSQAEGAESKVNRELEIKEIQEEPKL